MPWERRFEYFTKITSKNQIAIPKKIMELPYVEMISVLPGPMVIREDPADDMFLHCAVAGHAQYIISGDRQLLGLKAFRRIKILSPADFLAVLSAC
jgi:predicted nucleic acid-binding protein